MPTGAGREAHAAPFPSHLPVHEAPLQHIYDTAPIGLAFLSPECRYLQINQRLTEICGISVEGHIGHTVRECVPALAGAVETIVAKIMATGEPVTGIEVAGQRPDQIEQRSWITYWHPVHGPDGAILGVNVAAEEITERKRAETALRASEEQFRTLADSIPQLVWMSDPRGRIFWFNRKLSAFAVLPDQAIIGSSWPAALAPDSGRDAWAQSLITGVAFEAEVQLRGRDGAYHPFLTRIVPLRHPDGTLYAWLGTHIDISEQKKREEHIRFIVDELSHRTKNLLAVIMAIARQTSRHAADVADYHTRLTERLSALGQSHDLLVRDSWNGASFADLVAMQLKPFNEAGPGRIDVDGPPLILPPKAVQYLGLAFHELATNASKHGALSGAEGRISIRWLIDEETRRIRLRWSESRGPAVTPPSRRGFGHVVIEQIVPRSLGGRGRLDFAPEGVSWAFDFPLQDHEPVTIIS